MTGIILENITDINDLAIFSKAYKKALGNSVKQKNKKNHLFNH